jgi:hypothetical protein
LLASWGRVEIEFLAIPPIAVISQSACVGLSNNSIVIELEIGHVFIRVVVATVIIKALIVVLPKRIIAVWCIRRLAWLR